MQAIPYRTRRMLAAAPIVTLVVLMSQGVGSAAPDVDVIVDSTAIDLTEKDGADATAKAVLLNATSSAVVMEPELADDPGCTVSPEPARLPPGARQEVTFAFDAGCDVDAGIDLVVGLVGASPSSVTLDLNPPETTTSDWDILGKAAGIAMVAGLITLVGGLLRVRSINSALNTEEALAKRLVAARIEFDRLQRARGARMYPPSDDVPGQQDVVEPKVGFRTPLTGLGTDWSFKDSWASTVTIGSTAVVALLASSDILKSLLGSEPEAAIGLIAVAGGIASLIVTLGPLIQKAFGTESGTATVGGALAAAAVTIGGTSFQISALTIQAARLLSGLWIVIGCLGGVVALSFVLLYGWRSVRGFLQKGTTPQATKVSEQVRAAWIIARAINPDETIQRLSPLEIDELLAKDQSLTEVARQEVSAVIDAMQQAAESEPLGATAVDAALAAGSPYAERYMAVTATGVDGEPPLNVETLASAAVLFPVEESEATRRSANL